MLTKSAVEDTACSAPAVRFDPGVSRSILCSSAQNLAVSNWISKWSLGSREKQMRAGGQTLDFMEDLIKTSVMSRVTVLNIPNFWYIN